MTTDPRQLHVDHLPTPFTADEIRAGCPPGRTVRCLVVEPGREAHVRVTVFVSGDADGAEHEVDDARFRALLDALGIGWLE